MNQLYGLVLCGGKSSRLGFPKFQIEKEGVALYKWWVNTLNTVCEKTYISCQAKQKTNIDYGLFIEDESENTGPLEGICKAFQLNNKVNWLIVACDLVYADFKDITILIENNQADADAICFQNPETGQPFSLLTIYNKNIVPALFREYESELKSPKRLLAKSNTLILKLADLKTIQGINTPEELNNYKNNLLSFPERKL